MGNQTRARSISIILLCACLVLGGAVAIVWGLHRPPHNGTIALPTATTISATAQPGSSSSTTPSSSPSATTGSSTPAPAAPPSPPTKVDIPSINEGSSLLQLGTTTAGAIAVPTDTLADHAGWYNGSPMPGQDGPAVIVGHSTSSRGAAVFYELAQVKVGATVHVATKDGKALTFTVYKVASYPKTNFPTNTVYANTSGPELRVVTCGGTFDTQTGHHRNNTVVYARLAS